MSHQLSRTLGPETKGLRCTGPGRTKETSGVKKVNENLCDDDVSEILGLPRRGSYSRETFLSNVPLSTVSWRRVQTPVNSHRLGDIEVFSLTFFPLYTLSSPLPSSPLPLLSCFGDLFIKRETKHTTHLYIIHPSLPSVDTGILKIKREDLEPLSGLLLSPLL